MIVYLSIAFIITSVVAFTVSVLAPSLTTAREKKRTSNPG